MSMKKIVKEEVETVLLSLHEKIDFLRAKVEALCESTHACTSQHSPKEETKKDKK
tara:strand:- start:1140 stop:1304 length:165 start_codon:yes stop_codon:yes gene_type:complete